jgi:hypothetical protein
MYIICLHWCTTTVCTDVQWLFALMYNSNLHWCTTAVCTDVQQQFALMYNTSLHKDTTAVSIVTMFTCCMILKLYAMLYYYRLDCNTASLCNVIHTSLVQEDTALTNYSVIFWQLSAYCSVDMIIDTNYSKNPLKNHIYTKYWYSCRNRSNRLLTNQLATQTIISKPKKSNHIYVCVS